VKKANKAAKGSARGGRKVPTHAKRTKKRSKRASRSNSDKTSAWRREYYIPDYSIQRAARDLLMHSITEEIEDFAGRMFALQDLVDDEDLENISAVEKESDSPFFLAIVDAVRKEARTGDPEYARTIAGDFLEQAFRQDIATVRLWLAYENRMRQRRLDAGLGFIDPPDKEYVARLKAADEARPMGDDDVFDECSAECAPKLEVQTLEVKKLKVKSLQVGELKVVG